MTDQTPSQKPGLRDQLVNALGQIDTIPPVAHRRQQADNVLALLYREWPWLRAVAEDVQERLDEAEALAEQHARNTSTVARERESYRAAWKEEQVRRARAEAELRNYAEAESADAAAGSYAMRAEQAEAFVAFVADTIADHEGDEWANHPATTTIRAAFPAIAHRVWTPPPPGSTREQLPDAVLAAIRPGPYLSTACHAAFLCETSEPTEELAGWPQRLHARCRINNKFTGKTCICGCHGAGEPATPSEVDDTDLTEADVDRMMADSTPVELAPAPPEPGLYGKLTGMFSGPLPWPADVPPATALPCAWAHTRHAHTPHAWQPQPGMRHVQCPGYTPAPAATEATDT